MRNIDELIGRIEKVVESHQLEIQNPVTGFFEERG